MCNEDKSLRHLPYNRHFLLEVNDQIHFLRVKYYAVFLWAKDSQLLK